MLKIKKNEIVTNDKGGGLDEFQKQTDAKDLKPDDEIPLFQVIELERNPDSKLAYQIASHLAEVTAERFVEAVEDMEPEMVEEIMTRMQNSNSDTLVGMLQMLFIAKGMRYAAYDLDVLVLCEIDDEYSSYYFQDKLEDTKEFEWFRLKCMLEDQIHEGISEMISVLEVD